MKALYYFRWIMVVVYLGLGLLLLFSQPDSFLPDLTPRMRRILGGVLLLYGLFRGIQAWRVMKRINKNDDH